MFKELFSYSTELSVSVSVPQLLSPVKSSSSRISPVLITGRVAVWTGSLFVVGGMICTVCVGGTGLEVGEPRRLDAIRATPPSPKTAQVPIRHPTIQRVGIPALAAVIVAGAGFCWVGAPVVGRGGGTVVNSDTFSTVASARSQAATNSAAVAKRSRGSFESAFRITCSMAGRISGLTREGGGSGSL